MNRVNVNKMNAAAESWAEAFLAFLIALPPPFTSVALLALVVVPFVVGALLL